MIAFAIVAGTIVTSIALLIAKRPLKGAAPAGATPNL
jgi:hypothetical protein